MLFLLAPQSKIQDIQERQQRNHKPNRHVIGPDISHQHWAKGSACYSHNDIGWCFLCRRTHTFQAECKDCREHNGHEEKRKIERIQRNRTDRHDDAIQTASAKANHVRRRAGDIHFIVKLPDRRPIINKAIPPKAKIREASIFVIEVSTSVT